MIKQALALSFVLISAQALASTPCPTCQKGYVASSLEEVLTARQKTKEPGLKKASLDSSFSQPKAGGNAHPKSPVEILVNQGRRNDRNAQAKPIRKALQTDAPKDLETINTISRPPYTGSSYFSNNHSNHNLRGTFDRNMAISTQQQLRQHIRNLKK